MATVAAGVPAQPAPFSMRVLLVPLIALILGTFMIILDSTAVNVALPTLVKDFHSSVQSLQWVLTGYILAQAAMVPLAGWFSDRFGAKQVFLASITLFTLGSALCATAQTTNMLILFRIIQGVGGGFVLPIATAYIYRLSPPEKRGQVMGVFAVPVLIGPAIGPTLAGWLVEYVSWRWIFLVNVPICMAAVLIGMRGLPTVARKEVGSLDLTGMVLGPLAFAAIVYGINEGSTSWTSTATLAGLIGGGIALAVFIVVELRARNPLLEMRVFTSVDFSLAIVTQWVGQASLFGGIFLIPLFLQQVRGYGAFDTGLTLVPQALGALLFALIGGRLFDRIGARPLVVVGLGVVGGSTFGLAHLTATTRGWDIAVWLFLRGVGMGLMMMSLNTHLLNAAPRDLVSRVTSLTSALQSVVGSIAIAGLSTLLASRIATHVDALGTARGHGGKPVVTAVVSGYNDVLLLTAIIAIAGALIGFSLRRNAAAQRPDAPPVAVRTPAQVLGNPESAGVA